MAVCRRSLSLSSYKMQKYFNSFLDFVFDLYCKHDLLICYRFVFGESHRCAFSNFLSYSAITNIINSLLLRHSSLPLVGIGRFLFNFAPNSFVSFVSAGNAVLFSFHLLLALSRPSRP